MAMYQGIERVTEGHSYPFASLRLHTGAYRPERTDEYSEERRGCQDERKSGEDEKSFAPQALEFVQIFGIRSPSQANHSPRS